MTCKLILRSERDLRGLEGHALVSESVPMTAPMVEESDDSLASPPFPPKINIKCKIM